MFRKGYTLFVVLAIVALVLAACNNTPAPGEGGETSSQEPVKETVVVKETVIVTVEVPAEAPAATPQVQIEVAQAPGFGETLAAVQARGNLICGVNGQLPG